MGKRTIVVWIFALSMIGYGSTQLLVGETVTALAGLGVFVITVHSINVSSRDNPLAGGIAFTILLTVLVLVVSVVGAITPSENSQVSESNTQDEPVTSGDIFSDVGKNQNQGAFCYLGDHDYGDFSSQQAAQEVDKESGGVHGRDGDGDGVAYERLDRLM